MSSTIKNEDSKVNISSKRSSRSDNRLFPINTYVENSTVLQSSSTTNLSSPSSPESR